MMNYLRILLLCLLFSNSIAQIDKQPIFELNPNTHVFVNENNDAFKISYAYGDKKVETDWIKNSYSSKTIEVRNDIIPLRYFTLEDHLIDQFFFTNTIALDAESRDKYNIGKDYYFKIEMVGTMMFIEQNALIYKDEIYEINQVTSIDLKSNTQTVLEDIDQIGRIKDTFYYLKAALYFGFDEFDNEVEDELFYIYSCNNCNGKDFNIVDSIYPNEFGYPSYVSIEEVVAKKLNLTYSAPTINEVTLETKPKEASSYSKLTNVKYKKKLLKKASVIYDEDSILIVRRDGIYWLYENQMPEAINLTENPAYNYGHTSIFIKDQILGIEIFHDADETNKIHIQKSYFSLVNDKFMLKTFNSESKPRGMVDYNMVHVDSASDINIINNQLVFYQNGHQLINHTGEIKKLEEKETAPLLKDIFGALKVQGFNNTNRETTQGNEWWMEYVNRLTSETGNSYVITTPSKRIFFNGNLRYFYSYELSDSVAEVIPLDYKSELIIYKDKSIALKIAPRDYYTEFLNEVTFEIPKGYAGFAWLKDYETGEFKEYSPLESLAYDEMDYDAINNQVLKMNVGVIPFSKNKAIIKALVPDYLEFAVSIDMESGMPMYGEYGDPLYEYILHIGTSNSGIYDFENRKWIIPATANNIMLCKNGYIADYSYYSAEESNKLFRGYDLQGNMLWEIIAVDEKSVLELHKKYNYMNDEVLIWDDNLNFVSQNANGKQSLRTCTEDYPCVYTEIENADVFLSTDPLIYLKNDSLFIGNYQPTEVRNKPEYKRTFIAKKPFNRLYMERVNVNKEVYDYSYEYDNSMMEEDNLFMISNSHENKNIVLDTIPIYLRKDLDVMWVINENNKLFYSQNQFEEVYIDPEYGIPTYDEYGDPVFVDMSFKSKVYDYKDDEYSYSGDGYYPVLTEYLYGCIPGDDDLAKESFYKFVANDGSPVATLNDLKLTTIYMCTDTRHYIGYSTQSKLHNAILFNEKGEVLFSGYKKIYEKSMYQYVGIKSGGKSGNKEEELLVK